MDYGILYSGDLPILEGYSDASLITNEENNFSTSGWVFVYGGGSISWSSKKQTCIADFTFIALADKRNYLHLLLSFICSFWVFSGVLGSLLAYSLQNLYSMANL